MAVPKKLKIFLCHASQDKPIVRELYKRLLAESWIDPWLDEEKLLPGQDWDLEIEKAVEASDAVIVCLSNQSVTKEGYVQRELKIVLDIALEKPEGTIFVIPFRLEDCTLPRRLRALHYVDYFPMDYRNAAYQRLLQSLRVRYGQLVPEKHWENRAESISMELPVSNMQAAKPSVDMHAAVPMKAPAAPSADLFNAIAPVLPIIFFILTTLFYAGFDGNQVQFVWGIIAILAGLYFFIKREIPSGLPFKILLIVFLIAHSVVSYGNSSGDDVTSIPVIVEGISALVIAGVLVANFRSPRKAAPYAAVSLAVFLILVGSKLILNLFDFYPDGMYPLIIISAIISSLLVLLDL